MNKLEKENLHKEFNKVLENFNSRNKQIIKTICNKNNTNCIIINLNEYPLIKNEKINSALTNYDYDLYLYSDNYQLNCNYIKNRIISQPDKLIDNNVISDYIDNHKNIILACMEIIKNCDLNLEGKLIAK